ncbi:hypothetical protein FB565_000184 [Actinoplanes lutulentus]|uniref:Uncharacterized protein n=1 Tax=Actinoplanes lutulentus TaxID=1287878 RepID=A0A327Z4X0_9ACTN|nr:hypothetical protein [Actinoplanes lutulentus]RAK25463.1 hypothetical protein B0I29_1332 [Actinoplanes lutulentus]
MVPIGELRRPRVKGIVYVVNGVVTRVRAIDPNGQWDEDDRGYVDVPVTKPLTDVEIAQQFPSLPLRVGEERPTRSRQDSGVRAALTGPEHGSLLPLIPAGTGKRRGRH